MLGAIGANDSPSLPEMEGMHDKKRISKRGNLQYSLESVSDSESSSSGNEDDEIWEGEEENVDSGRQVDGSGVNHNVRLSQGRWGCLDTLLTRAAAYSGFLGERLKQYTVSSDPADFGTVDFATSIDESGEQRKFEQPSLMENVTLRDYQLEGVRWLVGLYENGLNGILADEMGLGKTVECLAFLAFLIQQGVNGPFLIVAPLSTISNWHREAKKILPTINCLLYYGADPQLRCLLRQQSSVFPEELFHHQHPFDSSDSSSEGEVYTEEGSSGRCVASNSDIIGKLRCAQDKASSSDVRVNQQRADDEEGTCENVLEIESRREKEAHQIVITSYEMALKDARHLRNISWKYLIVDEGHRLKNDSSVLLRELLAFKSSNRLLLTGTPLQNSLRELWSLLHFLLPTIFADVDDFLSWFDFTLHGDSGNADSAAFQHSGGIAEKSIKNGGGKLKEMGAVKRARREDLKDTAGRRVEEMVAQLHLILKPLVLRRLKCDVELSLPLKREFLITVPLSTAQRELYEASLTGSLREKLQEKTGGTLKVVGGLMNRLMQQRKICNHPLLFTSNTSSVEDVYSLIEDGSKMGVLDQLLKALIAGGHRVLVFSQMTRMLDLIEEYLQMEECSGLFKYCRIDGSTSHEEREEQIALFDGNVDFKVFLLSTRAGGLGINLVSADTVIFYDSDWNPQVDLQAQDRVHRIGQMKPVHVFRLCTALTSESVILRRSFDKRCLERLVMHKQKFKGRVAELLRRDPQTLTMEEWNEIVQSAPESIWNGRIGDGRFLLNQEEMDVLMDRSSNVPVFKSDLVELVHW